MQSLKNFRRWRLTVLSHALCTNETALVLAQYAKYVNDARLSMWLEKVKLPFSVLVHWR